MPHIWPSASAFTKVCAKRDSRRCKSASQVVFWPVADKNRRRLFGRYWGKSGHAEFMSPCPKIIPLHLLAGAQRAFLDQRDGQERQREAGRDGEEDAPEGGCGGGRVGGERGAGLAAGRQC